MGCSLQTTLSSSPSHMNRQAGCSRCPGATPCWHFPLDVTRTFPFVFKVRASRMLPRVLMEILCWCAAHRHLQFVLEHGRAGMPDSEHRVLIHYRPCAPDGSPCLAAFVGGGADPASASIPRKSRDQERTAKEIRADERAEAARMDTDASWTVRQGKAKVRPGSAKPPRIAVPVFDCKSDIDMDMKNGIIRHLIIADVGTHDLSRFQG